MFKRHALTVQVVKTPKQNDAPEEEANQLNLEQFSHVAKEQAKYAALLIGAAYTVKVVLDTAQEIALIIAKAKIQ